MWRAVCCALALLGRSILASRIDEEDLEHHTAPKAAHHRAAPVQRSARGSADAADGHLGAAAEGAAVVQNVVEVEDANDGSRLIFADEVPRQHAESGVKEMRHHKEHHHKRGPSPQAKAAAAADKQGADKFKHLEDDAENLSPLTAAFDEYAKEDEEEEGNAGKKADD
eukprot:TRINITY_DN12587_c0_g1_i1.p1 TRINITY_DN12587_c0_g1~~TRINITY_DN12587_c0_g1_i1.p1  ORF type:complete len:168 (-),score=59.71 TRINITY_DN12587_c0_g1_i1:240-743(-)